MILFSAFDLSFCNNYRFWFFLSFSLLQVDVLVGVVNVVVHKLLDCDVSRLRELLIILRHLYLLTVLVDFLKIVVEA